MRTDLKIGIIVAVLLITFIVIIKLISPTNRESGKKVAESHDSKDSKSRDGLHPRHWSGTALAQSVSPQPNSAVASPPQPMPLAALPAPTLRCYDYFEFPNEGGFHVKTCSAPSNAGISSEKAKNGDVQASKPTRIFLQWFPVENVASYKVYCSRGPTVSTAKGGYFKSWPVAGNSYYFESEPLDGKDCWSTVVTAINKDGVESLPSATYTTCSV